jgi:hypothetical protein
MFKCTYKCKRNLNIIFRVDTTATLLKYKVYFTFILERWQRRVTKMCPLDSPHQHICVSVCNN